MAQQGSYADGAQVGLWTTWWPSGKRRIEGLWVANSRHGPFRAWTADGELADTTWHGPQPDAS